MEEFPKREAINIDLVSKTFFNGFDNTKIGNYVDYTDNRNGRGNGNIIYVKRNLQYQ